MRDTCAVYLYESGASPGMTEKQPILIAAEQLAGVQVIISDGVPYILYERKITLREDRATFFSAKTLTIGEKTVTAEGVQAAAVPPPPKAVPTTSTAHQREIIGALQYLTDNDRPIGGEDLYNAIHLEMLAAYADRLGSHGIAAALRFRASCAQTPGRNERYGSHQLKQLVRAMEERL